MFAFEAVDESDWFSKLPVSHDPLYPHGNGEEVVMERGFGVEWVGRRN